jgi:hypothetical protein
MFTNSPSAAEVSRRPTTLHQGSEETGMEQLDPEDGLPIWNFTEGSEVPREPRRRAPRRRSEQRDLARLESRPLEPPPC